MDVVTANPATEDELHLFHSDFYLSYLKEKCNSESIEHHSDASNVEDDDDSDCSNVDDEQLEYGLGECVHEANIIKHLQSNYI